MADRLKLQAPIFVDFQSFKEFLQEILELCKR